MDTDMMREFIALAEHLNFTAAANSLFIAQPTLSKHVSQLEKQLQVRLLNRTKRDVSLTQAGEILLSACQDITSRTDKLLNDLSLLRTGRAGNVRLGVLYYAISDFVTPILMKMGHKYSDISISLASYQPLPLHHDLLSGAVDAAIMYRRIGETVDLSVAFVDIQWEYFSLIVPKTSALSQRQSITVSELSDLAVFTQRQTPTLAAFIKRKFAEKGAERIRFLDTDHVDTMATDVLIHNAASVTTNQSAHNVSGDKIHAIPITDPDMRVMMTCAYRKDNSNPALPRLLEAAREAFPAPED